MTMADDNLVLEEQIGQWRGYAERHRQLHAGDLDEMEDHLRATVADLTAAGLYPDEAFLVAVKRMGSLSELSREFSRTHSERLWKQLVLAAPAESPRDPEARRVFVGMLVAAILAAVAIKVPALFGHGFASGSGAFYAHNFALFAFTPLVGYFAWRRRIGVRLGAVLVGLLAVGAVAINAYPFKESADTEVLAVLHLVLALWLVVGLAYTGGDWRDGQRRMDFIRFTGEAIIYMALIAIGGGVLTGVVAGTFNAIHIDPQPAISDWIVPCGVVGALVVAAWLVEAKQSVVENMAPVLTRLFTPLFAVALIAVLVGVVIGNPTLNIERDVLIIFNAVLVVVLGLLLYSLSARDPQAPPTLFDRVQLVLVYCALAIDVVVLVAIFGHATDRYGLTPNRTAALGQNIVLLANLAWSAALLGRFVRRRAPFAPLERWQTSYIPVYAAWAWFVVLAFPPIFRFA
jgi:hypothetical protein